jgi:hypothetical protein
MAAVSLSLVALEAFKSTLLIGKMTLDVRGADDHRKRGITYSTRLTYLGLFAIVIASGLQVAILWYSRQNLPPNNDSTSAVELKSE